MLIHILDAYLYFYLSLLCFLLYFIIRSLYLFHLVLSVSQRTYLIKCLWLRNTHTHICESSSSCVDTDECFNINNGVHNVTWFLYVYLYPGVCVYINSNCFSFCVFSYFNRWIVLYFVYAFVWLIYLPTHLFRCFMPMATSFCFSLSSFDEKSVCIKLQTSSPNVQ